VLDDKQSVADYHRPLTLDRITSKYVFELRLERAHRMFLSVVYLVGQSFGSPPVYQWRI
jgi:hypothetical protein